MDNKFDCIIIIIIIIIISFIRITIYCKIYWNNRMQ